MALDNIFVCLSSRTKAAVEIVDDVAKIFHYCKDQDYDDPTCMGDGKKTPHFETLKTIMEDYLMRVCK